VYSEYDIFSSSLTKTLSKPQTPKKLKQLIYANFNNLKGLHRLFSQITVVIKNNSSTFSDLLEGLNKHQSLIKEVQKQLLQNHKFIFRKLHLTDPFWDESAIQASFTEQELQLTLLLNQIKSMTSDMISKVEEMVVSKTSLKDTESFREDYKAFLALCLDRKTYVRLSEDLPGRNTFLTLINEYEQYWKTLLSPNTSKVAIISWLTSTEVFPEDQDPAELTNKLKPLFVLYYSELEVYKIYVYFYQIDSFLLIKNTIYKSNYLNDFKTLSKVETVTDFVITVSKPILVTSYSSYSLWSSRLAQKDKKRFLTIIYRA